MLNVLNVFSLSDVEITISTSDRENTFNQTPVSPLVSLVCPSVSHPSVSASLCPGLTPDLSVKLHIQTCE